MIPLPYTAAQIKALHSLLFTHHRVKIELELLTLNHSVVDPITNTLLSGEVIFDSTSDIQRQMNLELFDPDKDLNLDPDNPKTGTAYLTRMIRCTYHVGTMDRKTWYEIPLFTGPINKIDRTGPLLRIECLGKEVLSSGGLWSGISGYKNSNKVRLAQLLMRERAGEIYFDAVDNKSVTTKAISVEKDKWTLWGYVRRLMNGIGLQAFYDGRGTLRIRQRPAASTVTFDSTRILDVPNAGYDLNNFWNAVKVVGAVPKGKKVPLHAIRHAAASHPLSAKSLARNGVPYYKPKLEQSTDLDTQAEVNERANELLAEGLLQGVDVAVPVAVYPLLEEDDLITFTTEGFYSQQRAKKFTIPLTVTNPQMSIGYNLNVRPTALGAKLRTL